MRKAFERLVFILSILTVTSLDDIIKKKPQEGKFIR